MVMLADFGIRVGMGGHMAFREDLYGARVIGAAAFAGGASWWSILRREIRVRMPL